jgi:hypothetical protein
MTIIEELEHQIHSTLNNGFTPEESEEWCKKLYYALRAGRIYQVMLLADQIHTTWELKHNPRPLKPLNETPIATSNLPVRTLNSLAKREIIYWGDLANITREDLTAIPGIGPVQINKITQELKHQIQKRQE